MAECAFNPRVSIVVEWENALLSEGDRSVAMLREVRRQVQALAARASAPGPGKAAPPLELLLVYDRAEFDDTVLTALLDRHLGPADDVLRWRVLPAHEKGYYRIKDFGARSAAGDIIVFLDCDVIPEPGWLEQILSGLEDPGVQMVAGSAYIDPAGLVGKVFALTWFFPLRSKNEPLRAVNHFFANNLALRHCAGSAWKVCTNFRNVGLNPLLIPAAIAIAWYYYLLYWAGETLSQLRVPAIKRVRV